MPILFLAQFSIFSPVLSSGIQQIQNLESVIILFQSSNFFLTCKIVGTKKGSVTALGINPAGNWMTSGHLSGLIDLWDMQKGMKRERGGRKGNRQAY
jgi:hypothetical protein